MQIKHLAMGVIVAALAGSLALAAEGGTTSRWTLTEAHFESAGAELAPAAAAELEQVLARLKADPALRVVVEGHTDNQGPRSDRLALTRQRALAVAAWLIHRGVGPRRIVTKGYGGSRPVAANTTPEGRARNRRVEIITMTAGPSSPEPAAATAADRHARPVLEVPEQRWQFATVVEGTQIYHDFEVRNRGEAPLEIAKVRTD
jgi:hypothetical protein